MDPVIARPLIYFIMILLFMALLSLPFLRPGSPEFAVDVISVIVLLILLMIIAYDIRRTLRRAGY
ncbi:MAG: hypothetical protein GXO43_08250 [Crenarchaeota archaeon]|nr:hypothetical protein [Thermoproteota archaeon]